MSNKVLGCQLGPADSGEQKFPKKTSGFFEVHRTSDTHMGTLAPSNKACDVCRACTIQSTVEKVIKSDWIATIATRGRKKTGARLSEKNVLVFVVHRLRDNFLNSVALSNCVHGLNGTFTSQDIVCKVEKRLGWQLAPANSREQSFPKIRSGFIEVHRTSDTHTVSLSKRAYGSCIT